MDMAFPRVVGVKGLTARTHSAVTETHDRLHVPGRRGTRHRRKILGVSAVAVFFLVEHFNHGGVAFVPSD